MPKAARKPTQRRPAQRQPVRWHFGSKDRVSIHGVAYRVIESSPTTGHIFARVDDPESILPVTHEKMEEIRRDHRFRHERNAFDLTKARTIMDAGIASMRELPADQQEHINWKVDVCKRFLELEARGVTTRGDPSVEQAIEIIENEIASDRGKAADCLRRRYAGRKKSNFDVPRPKRLIEWVNKLVASGMNPLSLRNRTDKSGNWSPKISAEAYAILYKYALKFMSPEQPSIAKLHRDMKTEIDGLNVSRRLRGKPLLDTPSDDRLGEEIKLLPAFDVMAGREGVDVAVNYFRSVGDGLTDMVKRPMQRVEMDEWNVHLHVLLIRAGLWDELDDALKAKVKRVRMVLGAAICCASRCFVAMRLSRKANSENSVAMIDMMVSDKTTIGNASGATTPWEMHSTPELVCTDIGSSYANDTVQSIFTDLEVVFDYPRGGAPFLRGTIERVFRTVDQKLISGFTGRTFSDVVAKGVYDSQARAGLTVDELAEALVLWCVDIYHNTPHDGIGGETPRARWLKLTKEFPLIPPPDMHKRRVALGIELQATLGPKGLRCLGVWYRSRELQSFFELRGKVDVAIRVDQKDLGWISAIVDGDWLTVPGPIAMRGMSAKIWIATNADLRRCNVDMARLLGPVVTKASAILIKLDEKTRTRLNIADNPMSPKELARAHRNKSLGVEFIDDEAGTPAAKEPAGLFDGAVKVSGRKRKAAAESTKKAPETKLERSKTGHRRGTKKATTKPNSPPSKPRTRARKRWIIED